MASPVAAGAASVAASSAPPAVQCLLQDEAGVQLFTGVARAAPALAPVAGAAWTETALTAWSPDGAVLAVAKKACVQLLSGPVCEACVELPEEGVSVVAFSPKSTFITTWRRRADAEPNLKVWRCADGACVAAYTAKSYVSQAWPLIKWTADEAVAFRLGVEGVVAVDGSMSAPKTILHNIPGANVQQFWVGPGPAPYSVLTFTPSTKSGVGSATLWAYPRLAAPVASKSMQADNCRAVYNSAGTSVLVEMTKETSSNTYYGDSRLFLLSTDGKISTAVSCGKDGAVYDFAWHPKGDTFAMVTGCSPPMATLHAKDGKPVFSFGSGGFNRVYFQPQGRFLLVGGFGNMPGDFVVWDVLKQKAVSPKVNTPCAVTISWSPCGRYILAATTKPRMNVDNGYRVWSHNGTLVQHVPMTDLFTAVWRPAPAATFPDRAASPMSATAVAAAAAARSVYRPPGAAGRAVTLLHATSAPVGKIAPTSSVAAATSGLPVGAVPAAMSDSAKRRAKERAKKAAAAEAEAAAAEVEALKVAALATPPAAGAGAASAAVAAEEVFDPAKELRKLLKKLKQIQDLEASKASGASLNAEQMAKLATAVAVREQVTALQAQVAAAGGSAFA